MIVQDDERQALRIVIERVAHGNGWEPAEEVEALLDAIIEEIERWEDVC